MNIEEKPNTLMPNSCPICGASFVDHGNLACSDDVCLYDRRQEVAVAVPQILAAIATPHAPRAPREANTFWPAMRCTRIVNHLYGKMPRTNHVAALQLIAKKGNMTVEKLLKTDPITYLKGLRYDNHMIKQILTERIMIEISWLARVCMSCP